MPLGRMSRKITVLSFLCLLVLMVPAVFAENGAEIDLGKILSPVLGTRSYMEPSLSGDFLVFFAFNQSEDVPDLFSFNLKTGELALICEGETGLSEWSTVRTGSRWIVYTKDHVPQRAGTPHGTDIFAFDRNSGSTKLLGTSTGANAGISLSGNTIVWVNGTKERVWPGLTNTKEYFVLSSITGHTSEDIFSKTPENPKKPTIDRDLLVYEKTSYHPENKPQTGRTITSDIFVYNLTSGSDSQISFSGTAHSPSVSGSIVVWEDPRNGNADIYLYNLTGKQEFPVCLDPADQHEPKISGDWIVWVDKRHQPVQPQRTPCPAGQYCPVETPLPPVSDIYLFDLTKKTESRISGPSDNDHMWYRAAGENRNPAVSDHQIVWTRNGDIFMYPAVNVTTPMLVRGAPKNQPAPGWDGPLAALAVLIAAVMVVRGRKE